MPKADNQEKQEEKQEESEGSQEKSDNKQEKESAKKKVSKKKESRLEYYATGRRKDAVARVRLIPGKGNIIINGRVFEQYFGYKNLRMFILKPFELTDTLNQFDVIARIEGGGTSGQAGALQHGIARALLEVSPDFRDKLKKSGLLTRDPRMKERKKYGLKKARKAPQFSKR